MNARLLKFSLASIGMHLAVSWGVLHSGSFEHGVAQGSRSADSPLTVSLLAPESKPDTADSLRELAAQTASIESLPAPETPPEPAPIIRPVGIPDALQSLAVQDYVEPGRLTRVPAPASEIDLNVAEISSLGYSGRTNLTILINADGTVADVVSGPEEQGAPEFVERVAARFKGARFIPGEIDGVAVKSRLKITVVSEDLLPVEGN